LKKQLIRIKNLQQLLQSATTLVIFCLIGIVGDIQKEKKDLKNDKNLGISMKFGPSVLPGTNY
jgi:hypothetical protein